MALETFVEKSFSPESERWIEIMRDVTTDYQNQGLTLTLRQLYYQLVANHGLPNTERSYKRMGSILSDARLAGRIDWEAIEDRARLPREPSHWSGVNDLVASAISAYRLDRWEGQDHYIELWVEKDALAGVLEPLANRWHITLSVNRGYSSSSAMYAASRRFINAAEDGKSLTLLYLGDHDPSGEDMVRDIEDRLTTFDVQALDVRKLALTMEQIRKYRPPPNPAKMSDSRAAAYVAKFGTKSWEVDALPPKVLQAMINAEIERYVDLPMMEAVKRREEKGKEELRKAVARIGRSDDDE